MSRAKMPLRRHVLPQGEDWDESDFFGYGTALQEEFFRARTTRYEEERREPPRRPEGRFEERSRIFGQTSPDED